MSEWDSIKGLSAPARRALANAGHETLKDLTKVSEAALAELHGMGPKAVTALRVALMEKGLSFKK
jgi:DNA-directed RNA polymerase alpha subunit